MFPEVLVNLIDQELENQMAMSRKVLEAVRRGRQAAAIKGRQPIKEILIEGNSVTEKTLIPVRE